MTEETGQRRLRVEFVAPSGEALPWQATLEGLVSGSVEVEEVSARLVEVAAEE